MLKQGREINTKISDLFKTSYGTVDVSSLRSIYLNMSTWVEPIEEAINWSSPIKKVKSTIKHKIHNQLNDSPFKDKTIVDLDLRASGIKPGKRSFLRCEVTLYLKELKYKDIKVPCISDSVINITDKIINETLLTSTVFRFYKSKK
jgi:hypothetical protein|tara:strand:+ start:1006 stop:1443 length:438 start_codon:yes stop_codon:yes gene_type:complete